MKTKRNFLIKQSLKKKLDTKWFKIVNVILAVVLVAITNIDKVINYFGGDFNETTKIILVSNVDVTEEFKAYFDASRSVINDTKVYEIESSTEDIKTLKENLSDENKNIIIEIEESNEEYLKATITSYDTISTINYQLLTSTLNAVKSEYALSKSNIDPIELAKITTPMNVESMTTNPDLTENGIGRDVVGMVVMMIFIIPMFILIVYLVQMIGAEINDEKSTRSMEIIISNVTPRTHFFSKIIASTSFVLIQGALLLVYGGLGLVARMLMNGGIGISAGSELGNTISDVMEMLKNTGVLSALTQAIPLIILLLVATLFAYAILSGVLASMTTNIEDYQQLQAPLMIIMMAGYMIAIMGAQFEGSAFVKICSFIPFLSAFIAPSIYLLGQLTLLDLGISLALMCLTCFAMFRYGLRIYKVGILNYSSKGLWKKIFKSMKNEE